MTKYGIYIHIPFCKKKCPYCDFFSQIDGDVEEYVKKLCFIIKKSEKVSVGTIYFGGGTPSLIDSEYISNILQSIRETFAVNADAEITIECNPNSLTREKLETYKKIGINRISIGVQSFKDKTLKILGRIHNVKQAKDAIKLAAKYFDNVSIDLIHSVPNCKVKLLGKYLNMVQHVSAYCLTSDKFPSVKDKISIKEQTKIEKKLNKYHFEKYEVSNFAKSGYRCRHNMTYWTCGRWLGFGVSAEGNPEKWTDSDRIMLGLRLTDGIEEKLLENKKNQVDELVKLGLLQIKDDRISATRRGFFVLNQIIIKLT